MAAGDAGELADRAEDLASAPTLDQLRRRAESLIEALTARPPSDEAVTLRGEFFPQRAPTRREVVATAALADQEPAFDRSLLPLSRTGAQLVLARAAGSDSWGALEARVAARQPELAAFQRAVRSGTCDELKAALGHTAVRAEIDRPWFDFDAPAIVQVKRDLERVDLLLGAGADVHARSDWWAGGFGVLDGVDAETARVLIERGAVLDPVCAAEQGWVEELERAILADPALVHFRGGDGQTPLHRADAVEVAELLLDHGADPAAYCLDHDAQPAHYLIGDKPDVVRLLLRRGAPCDLFLAAALGDEELVHAALEAQPESIDWRIGREPFPRISRDHGGHILQWTLGFDKTPHDVAREHGHDQVFDLLIERSGACTRLLALAAAGRREEALALAAKQSDLVASLPEADQQLLAVAAWNRQRDLVELFLDLGFDPHVPGPERSTPLDRASWHGFDDVVELLLRRDPDPPLEFRNQYGGTPLTACLHGAQHSWRRDGNHARTVRLLMAAGAVVPEGVEVDAVLADEAGNGSGPASQG